MAIPAEYVSLENAIYRLLDTVGDGSGTTDAAVDGSTEAKEFLIAPGTGELFCLNRLLVNIQANTNLGSQEYGDIAELANGIKIYLETGGVRTQFSFGAIKSHDDWAGVCFDSVSLNYGNLAGKSVAVRWSFFKAGDPIWLDGDKSEKFIIQINDDLSGLKKHVFQVQGRNHAK